MDDMDAKLYAQKDNLLKVRVLDHSEEPSRSVFKLEVLKTLSGEIPVGTILEVSEHKGLFKHLAPEKRFFLV